MSALVILMNTAQSRLILQGFNMHQDIKEYRAGNRCAAYSLGASRAEQRGDYDEAEKPFHLPEILNVVVWLKLMSSLIS